jgi:hypothetical protein
MDQTLNTPELLQEILLNLPTRSLLLAQRVNQAWKSMITNSPRLQEALFLRAKQPRKEGSCAKAEVNRLLQEVFPPFFEIEKSENNHSHQGLPFPTEAQSRTWNERIEISEPLLRKEASWRGMFPTQPPPKLNIVERASQFSCSERRGKLPGQSFESQLARMGNIYDYVERAMANEDTSFFCLHWHALGTSGASGSLQHGAHGFADFLRSHGGEEVKDEVTIYTRAYLSCVISLNHNPPRFQSVGHEATKIEFGEWITLLDSEWLG